ncbi:MAG: hypothetical protein ABIH56_01435 [Candidatus Margulisiibacteriota bacterium]
MTNIQCQMTNEGIDLLNRMKSNSRWDGKDDFPSCPEWEKEVKAWLKFISDEGQFERFRPRLKDKPSQRDSALAEISVAYYLSKIKGFKIIDWFPIGENGCEGEFVFDYFGAQIWCEVKAPGWESDFIINGVPSKRLSFSKYINGECRSVDDSNKIRHAVELSYKKFLENKINLLIIADDFIIPLNQNTYGRQMIWKSLYYNKLKPPYADGQEKECFMSEKFQNLSGLATFNCQLQGGNIQYDFKIYRNLNSVCPLPEKGALVDSTQDLLNMSAAV